MGFFLLILLFSFLGVIGAPYCFERIVFRYAPSHADLVRKVLIVLNAFLAIFFMYTFVGMIQRIIAGDWAFHGTISPFPWVACLCGWILYLLWTNAPGKPAPGSLIENAKPQVTRPSIVLILLGIYCFGYGALAQFTGSIEEILTNWAEWSPIVLTVGGLCHVTYAIIVLLICLRWSLKVICGPQVMQKIRGWILPGHPLDQSGQAKTQADPSKEQYFWGELCLRLIGVVILMSLVLGPLSLPERSRRR